MRSLWTSWPVLRRRLASTPDVLIFLDYDGTLTPIADHPSQAHLPAATKRVLARLARLSGVSVVLVSGRRLRDVKTRVGIPGLCYVGNHGLELQGPKLRYVHPGAQAARSILRGLARDLKAALEPIPGALVEEKGFSLSVHWRQVPQSASLRFQRAVTRTLAPWLKQGRIRVMHGKRVLEIRLPIDWDKGKIIAWILQRRYGSPHRPQPLILYLGDDRTDEDAFRVVNDAGGTSVFVGPRPSTTVARWWVRSPRDVHAVLARLLQERWQIQRIR